MNSSIKNIFKKGLLFAMPLLMAVSFIPNQASADNEAEPMGSSFEYRNNTLYTTDGPWEMNDYTKQPLVQKLNNGRDIYYSMAANDPYKKYFQEAVKRWNNLGVVNLVQVAPNDPNSEITLKSVPKITDTDALGYTTYDYGDDSNDLSNTVVQIDRHYLNKNYGNKFSNYNMQALITCEHEIGHALGFDHDDRYVNIKHKLFNYDYLVCSKKQYTTNKFSKAFPIMSGTGSFGKNFAMMDLSQLEQQNLEDHYNLKPTKNVSSYITLLPDMDTID